MERKINRGNIADWFTKEPKVIKAPEVKTVPIVGTVFDYRDSKHRIVKVYDKSEDAITCVTQETKFDEYKVSASHLKNPITGQFEKIPYTIFSVSKNLVYTLERTVGHILLEALPEAREDVEQAIKWFFAETPKMRNKFQHIKTQNTVTL